MYVGTFFSHLHTHSQPQTQGCITEGCFVLFLISTLWCVLCTEVPLRIDHRVFVLWHQKIFFYVSGKFLCVITKVNLRRVLKCYCAMWGRYFYIKGL